MKGLRVAHVRGWRIPKQTTGTGTFRPSLSRCRRPLGGGDMEVAPINPPMQRHGPNGPRRADGFSLLEMMMVVTVILILASIATPIYQTCVLRAREAVLRDHLFTLRALIDRFTLDNGRAPTRLEELVEKGYLGRLPTDPFTARE